MQKEMPYWLYKRGYAEYRGTGYNPSKKTIIVALPDVDRIKFPAHWIKSGNSYRADNNCIVRFWGKGLEETFVVEHDYQSISRCVATEIGPSLHARDDVIALVNSYAK